MQWKPRPLLLSLLIRLAASDCDLRNAALCNEPGGLIWSGGNASSPPSPSFALGCCLPSVHHTIAQLDGAHVLILGDSTFRYPVQFFQRAWLGCEPGRPFNLAAVRGEERVVCEPLYYSKVWLTRPVGGFFLENEFVTHVKGFQKTIWWQRWVLGKKPKKAARAANEQAPPDAVVLGAWLWHVKSGRSALREYESQLRAFLRALVRWPSYRTRWSQGRMFWREAPPTEEWPPYDSASCEAANAVAKRVLKELAPDVRIISLAPVVTHSTPVLPGNFSMTVDGKHFHWPVQVALLQVTLGLLVRDGVVRTTASHTSTASPAAVSASSTISVTRAHTATATSSDAHEFPLRNVSL